MELSPFYEKKVECLCCKKSFPTNKVRSKFVKVIHTDSDFCPTYSDSTVNALYYNVFVCEHCGFSFTEDFSNYFQPGVKEEITAQISDKWTKRSFNQERTTAQALEAYKLAFMCGILKKEKAVTLAGLTLRIAWLYRSLNNLPQEQRFVKMARDHYLTSYSNEDYAGTQMSGTRILYMIAELSRRIEDYELATRFFSKLIENQQASGEAKLLKMAKEQWQLVRSAREQNRGKSDN